jgi:PAS domain S-box-containing protein
MTNRQTGAKELLALALEATNDGVWTWNFATGEAYFSPRYYTMLGYEPDELPASYETWADLLHPDDAEEVQRSIRERIDRGLDSYEVEFRLRTKSGDWLWVLGRGKVVERDADGHPLLLVGSHVNIDRRKRTEERLARYRDDLEEMVRERTKELEETSSLLEATFNAIPDVLGVQDNRHRIIRYNDAGYRFLNMSLDEVSGRRCYELIGRTRECDDCATSECYRTKRPAVVTRYEEALDTWLDVRAYPILDDNGEIVRVIEHLRDITPEKRAEEENRELQERLRHAQKMESLGTLAGGIAHDFNNLLMGIQGRASLLSVGPAGTTRAREHIEAIEKYVHSAADLTKQLLGFARAGKYEVKQIDVNDLVVETATMFGRTRKRLAIETKVHPEPVVIAADRGQLEQVLLNILINAWQAMPRGGDLTLATGVVDLDEAAGRIQQVAPGRYCQIEVIDTGSGMDDATRQRVFDPFFTTKDKGRGTGLGLASAYGIVNNHGGTIAVESAPGEGSAFRVLLPLSGGKVEGDGDRPASSIGGNESILLVDDEQMILDVGRAMLEQLGYRVTTAGGGADAVEIIERGDPTIDLVIVDLVMPGMDGSRVVELIKAHRPELPILVSSGYALDGQAERMLEKGCQGFLQKPFNLAVLSEHLWTVLDAR